MSAAGAINWFPARSGAKTAFKSGDKLGKGGFVRPRRTPLQTGMSNGPKKKLKVRFSNVASQGAKRRCSFILIGHDTGKLVLKVFIIRVYVQVDCMKLMYMDNLPVWFMIYLPADMGDLFPVSWSEQLSFIIRGISCKSWLIMQCMFSRSAGT